MNAQISPSSETPEPLAVTPAAPGTAVTPLWLKGSLLVLAMLSGGSAWLVWQSSSRATALEQELVRRQQDSHNEVVEARVAARQAQELSRDAAARATLLEARLAEVALQRTQVEELIRSVNLSRDESVVAEIESALRVAAQQTNLTGSAAPMIQALQAAQDRITRVQQPGLEGVRRAIDKDLDRLRTARVADLATLSLRLDEAIRLMDDLPLLNTPENQRAGTSPAPSAHAVTRTSTTAPRPGTEDASTPEPTEEAAWSDKALQWSREWAQTVWNDTRGLVRLQRIEHPESILLAPEESFFLRENTKLRLLNARLALLSRQTPTALNDLRQVQSVLPRYFDMKTAKGKRLTQLLQDTGTQAQQTAVPRPDDTLAALAAVSGLH